MKKAKPPLKILTQAEQRQVQNEVVFREANERIQRDLDALAKTAKLEGHDKLIPAEELVLHFYCECSDENCHERIVLTLSKYQELHDDRRKFIVLPGHEAKSIEKVVTKETTYNVVDKLVVPASVGSTLGPTSINNT